MKITIDIPKEFEAHFAEDRFKDSLMRLAADRHSLAGKYEYELVEMLIRAFKDATCMESKQEDLISRQAAIDASSKTAATEMVYKNTVDLLTDTMDSQVIVDKGFYLALPEKKEIN